MRISDIIVHRGNSPVNTNSPLEQVGFYADAGFTKIEIDIYVITELTYKFCHPLDAGRIEEVYGLDDIFLNQLVEKYPNVEWYVDLKCLDLGGVPREMMQHLVDVFGTLAIFTAAQHEILEFMYKAGMRTGQYFKPSISQELDYKPNLYIQDDGNMLQYPRQETIVYCHDLRIATDYINKGFRGVMIDGDVLIETYL